MPQKVITATEGLRPQHELKTNKEYEEEEETNFDGGDP